MKKVLLIVACLLFGATANAKIRTIETSINKDKYFKFTGDFEKGVLQTGPIEIYYQSRENYSNLKIEGNYDAISSNFRGIIDVYRVGYRDETMICHCRISNNETKDKITIKNMRKDIWEIVIKEIELYWEGEVLSVKLLPKVTVYDNINCFLDMIGSNIEITFKNGNKCVGPRDGDEFCKDVIYEYTWSNGDKYVGTIYSSFTSHESTFFSYCYQIIPDEGKIILSNGEVISSDSPLFEKCKGRLLSASWEEWEEKGKYDNATPTEILKLIEEEKAERIRKEQEKEAERIRQEQEKKEKEIARRNELISKYGDIYGEAIYNKEPLLGMTVEMIRTIKGHSGELSTTVTSNIVYQTLVYYSYNIFSGSYGNYESYHFEDGKLTHYSITD